MNIKNTLCAVVMGIAAISGCNSPVEKMPEGGEAIVIPSECEKTKSLTFTHRKGYSLLCEDKQGRDIFYRFSEGGAED